MKIPKKKLKSGFELPVYGLGLWQMGGRWEADSSNDENEIAAIRAAIDAGVTALDTAESYGAGHSEELLKRAIEGYDRSKFFISTKVSGDHQSYEALKKSFHASLERMGLAYVDLYMLHRYPEPGTPIEETMRALDELVDAGLVRYIGVCNMTPTRFERAQAATKHKIVYNQVHYNVQYREAEKQGLLTHTVENDYFLAAWRPVQKGMLPDSELINRLAAKYNKTPYQIVINWLISQENVITLSKTSKIEHLHENLGALGWQLEEEDIEAIRQDYPDQKDVSDSVPLDYEGSDA